MTEKPIGEYLAERPTQDILASSQDMATISTPDIELPEGLSVARGGRPPPTGQDHGFLIRIVGIDVLLASAVAGASVLDRTWLLGPLMGLLFLSLALVVATIVQLLRDANA
jgi:hypothetical protein